MGMGFSVRVRETDDVPRKENQPRDRETRPVFLSPAEGPGAP
jgi:hypothetical protein